MKKLAEIRGYDPKYFEVGMVLSIDDKYLLSKQYSRYGEYDGYMLETTRGVSKIVYKSKYLDFMKKVILDYGEDYPITNKEDIIRFALDRKKLIGIAYSKYVENNELLYVKVLNFEDNFLEFMEVNRYGELMKKRKINIFRIEVIIIDSIALRTYEKILDESKQWIKNDIKYYYIKNALGDVISIIDENNNIKVKYEYDAYGNIKETLLDNTFKDLNSFMYW